MKYRVVEFRPDRYHVQRRGLLFWRPLGRPPFQFVSVGAAKDAATIDKLNRLEKKVLRHFKRKVVVIL